jgi:hypothetical protein
MISINKDRLYNNIFFSHLTSIFLNSCLGN